MRAVVDQVTQMFAGMASAKRLTLQSNVAGDVPEDVLVDGLRLRQVLNKFLSNAIKFTERSGITLDVRRVPAADQRDLVRFAVTDSGIGMDTVTITLIRT